MKSTNEARCYLSSYDLLMRIILFALMITIINFSNFNRVFAETSLYLCEIDGKPTYQDLPCSDSSRSTADQARNKTSVLRQRTLQISTPNTGVNNGRKLSPNTLSAINEGKYFSQPQPDTFQDSYTPELQNIESQRKELQQINHQLRCDALRLELWRLSYGAHRREQKAKREIGENADKNDEKAIGEATWVAKQREFLQGRLESNCKADSAGK